MTRGRRLSVFAVGAAGLAVLLAWGFAGLPDFGTFGGRMGETIATIAVPERHATNVVTSVMLDFRGFDTLGEEFILFAATIGVLALLRLARSEEEVPADPDETNPTAASRSVAVVCATLAPPTAVLAIYVVLHGHLTPGGGFQGGVILAGALLLAYLAGSTVRSGPLSPIAGMELAKGLGAAGFVAIAGAGLIFAAAFLENFLPLGTAGNLLSAGTYMPLNIAVGLEVAGAILVILGELLDQRLLTGEEEKEE
jgi:multicomponent Na+:H+ antiporter subunit B